MDIRTKIWRVWLRRPYRLHKAIDQGKGPTVVFLHGIGRSSWVWHHIADILSANSPETGEENVKELETLGGKAVPKVHMVAFDLLGFGESPKPDHVEYNVDDHARSVIAALTKLPRRSRPFIIVGHSMGCLVAVRVARLRPDLVRRLILYEMPLYNGLPNKRSYQARLRLYFNLYERIIEFKPIFFDPGKSRAQRLAEKLAGFALNDETWLPFVRSLKHTIMEQTTHEDIKELDMPMDVVYGMFDQVVIRGKVQEIFGEDAQHITAHTIRASHIISRKASRFLVERIAAALERKTGRSKRRMWTE